MLHETLLAIMQYCNIRTDIQNQGKEHSRVLKEMRQSCAFQSELESGKLSVLENSNYFKEQ